MEEEEKKQVTYTDIMEISILHFAYNYTIMQISRKFKIGEIKISECLNRGIKNKTVMRMVSSIINGNYWATKPEVEFSSTIQK